ncbi:hypothetical protein PAXINDRAFT_182509 [Paxillus involutus ATCC 200175]|uniref:Uncharacterized protein n=1 Tax=Paxillus involutus ATCC 200175 TaxID=664439 RepID=A0A0C9SWR0_PAXIN|nr:hypothetical protein PAXINDRAFT_182509 [Paxillus involutus ATCC 200175]
MPMGESVASFSESALLALSSEELGEYNQKTHAMMRPAYGHQTKGDCSVAALRERGGGFEWASRMLRRLCFGLHVDGGDHAAPTSDDVPLGRSSRGSARRGRRPVINTTNTTTIRKAEKGIPHMQVGITHRWQQKWRRRGRFFREGIESIMMNGLRSLV